MKIIDALDVPYRTLNKLIDTVLLNNNEENIILKNIFGQRYIGRGLSYKNSLIQIYGTPGNDMASYMNGTKIEVFGNGQDAIGNTMNEGTVIIHGDCGDTIGYAMRGGSIYIKGNVGYRVGIHMKEYKNMKPVIVIGGKAGEFLGEYMAGGIIIVLGIDISKSEKIVGKFCGTGMHGGVIYIYENLEDYNFGKEVKKSEFNEKDVELLSKHIKFYEKAFSRNLEYLRIEKFSKYVAIGKNPYSNMYCNY
ncbi:MAG: hypothetical protein LBL53_01320 [Endomicrobium sp.]|jgi:glutamate synthase domain-containing protein 3|nr:hypothetical protein [Endomicrobium sp.]